MTAVWMGITLPDAFWDAVAAACNFYTEVPEALAVAVAHRENGAFDPRLQSRYVDKDGVREPSWGYFQLHERGIGAGHPVSELQDGYANARIAIAEMARRIQQDGAVTEGAILPWTVHPDAWREYLANPVVYVDGQSTGGANPSNVVDGDSGGHDGETDVTVVTDPSTVPSAPSRIPGKSGIKTGGGSGSVLPGTPRPDILPSTKLPGMSAEETNQTLLPLAGLAIIIVAAYVVSSKG